MLTLFTDLYPNVMISSTNPAYNLTIANTASPSYTLKLMSIVAIVFLPVVLAYQAWNYYVFRKRISSPISRAPPAAASRGAAAIRCAVGGAQHAEKTDPQRRNHPAGAMPPGPGRDQIETSKQEEQTWQETAATRW